MAASEIIDQVREVLADPDADRWSDSRLVTLLNYGVKDLVFNTNILNSIFYFELDTENTTFDLSEKLLKIERVEYQGKDVPLLTHAQMDRLNPDWQSDSTADAVEAIIYDKFNPAVIRVYPSLTDVTYQSVTDSNYGILISFNISFEPSYITIEDYLSEPDVNKYIAVYGVPKPDVIVDVDSDRPLDSQWDEILVHYVVGHALRADMDAQNRAFGNEELMLK